MKGKDLMLRQQIKIAEKVPADLEKKITSFHRNVIGIRKQHNCQIGNMNETYSLLYIS